MRTAAAASPSAPQPRPRRRGGWAGVLWRFSRPHTVIGTWLGIGGLFAIALDAAPGAAAGVAVFQLASVLVAGTGVNVAIVGINQIADVDIDRINKPRLPIAAGELSPEAAWRVVAVAAAIPVAMALTQGWVETVAVVVALAIGAAYSVPPVRLKRHPVAASLCIAGVRSAVVNLGVAVHFSTAFGGDGHVPGAVWALCLFVLPFSFAIAVLKDVPDSEGDRLFRIATFTVRLGARRAAALGLGALGLAYAGMAIGGPFALPSANAAVLTGGHAAAALLLAWWAHRANPDDPREFTRFYMRVWVLFFLEYVLVPAAVLAG
jgi:homogentisate phytyltransferase/homogentisate geranylgeranyltransferase